MNFEVSSCCQVLPLRYCRMLGQLKLLCTVTCQLTNHAINLPLHLLLRQGPRRVSEGIMNRAVTVPVHTSVTAMDTAKGPTGTGAVRPKPLLACLCHGRESVAV